MANTALSGISNVVKLLPTTTLFAFQTLNPSFSNRGECLTANKYLSATLIIACSVTCALFSITDSVVHRGKLFLGIATFRGFYVFNFDEDDAATDRAWLKDHCRRKYRLKISDGVHVVFTVVVFLALAFSDAYVQDCFFASAGANGTQVLRNLPLGFGLLASFVFMIFPHSRKGIGYSDNADVADDNSQTEDGTELLEKGTSSSGCRCKCCSVNGGCQPNYVRTEEPISAAQHV